MALRTQSPYDVVVVGGGPAGIGAAVAAARNDSRTLLIERAPFLGGGLTWGLPMLTFFSLEGVQILDGIPQEFFARVEDNGGTPGHADTKGSWMRTYSLVDGEIAKYVAQELVLEAGAELLLHAFATDAVVEANRLRGVVIYGKGGQEVIPARIVIDCSGDADIVARAGASFQKGKEGDGQMQAVTLMFRLGHVDTDRLPEYFTKGLTFAVKPGATSKTFLRGATHFDRWEEAVQNERLSENPHHAIFVNSIRDGEFAANTTRIVGIDGTDTWDLTRAEVEGRRQVAAVHQFLKEHVPGFERSALIGTGPFIGVRETRRIEGVYKLTAQDVIEGRDFDDNIARGAFPVDIHTPDGSGITQEFVKDGGSYGIPYRVLIPKDVDQLLVAGRCASATHEAAGSTRVMGQCMAMGQAAGTAAALSLESDVSPRQLDVENLRRNLRGQGAVLEESDSPHQLEPLPADKIKYGEATL